MVDQSVFLPITQSLSNDNLCAPELSVAGTRSVIARGQSKMVLIYVLLNALTERCSHIRIIHRRFKACERFFEEERDLLDDSVLLPVG